MKTIAFAVALLAPLAAQAVVGTTSRTLPAGPGAGWTGVGRMSGASAVAVSPHLVLTAGHVGAGDFLLGGDVFHMGSTELAPKVSKKAVDLRLVYVNETLPSWYQIGSSAKNGAAVTMVGYGSGGTVDAAGKGYALTGGGAQTVGTNVLSDKGTTSGQGPTFRAKLKKAGDGVLTVGDSGGGWFSGGKLVGISDFVFSKSPKKANYGFSKDGYFGSGAIDLTNSTLQKWLKARIEADTLGANGSRSAFFAGGGSVQAVPEPAAFLPLGFAALAFARRRRRS